MKIKEFRESLNMTQKELADYLGVSRSALAMWESGCNYPHVETLIKLANKFNCTIDELVR